MKKFIIALVLLYGQAFFYTWMFFTSCDPLGYSILIIITYITSFVTTLIALEKRKFFKRKKDGLVKNKTKIVCGFPGVGKTYFYKNDPYRNYGVKVLDYSDIVYPKEAEDKFIDKIKSKIGEIDIILINGYEKEFRDLLIDSGLEIFLVYPDINQKQEYLDRYKQRGSNKSFINKMDERWDNMIKECYNQSKGCQRIELSPDQYLEDVIPTILNKDLYV